VPNEARVAQIEAALSNSFAFGGLNAVLAFRRITE
jgi:nodulation protein E